MQPRVPISAKLVADLITAAGATACSPSTCTPGRSRASSTSRSTTCSPRRSSSTTSARRGLADPVVVSPDAGGVERARAIAKRLDAGLAIIDKRRDGPERRRLHVPHRRREGQGRRHHRRHDRHRGHAGPGRRRAQARGRPADPRLRRPSRALRARHGAHRRRAARGARGHEHDSARPGQADPQDHGSLGGAAPGEAIRRIHDEESVSTLFV